MDGWEYIKAQSIAIGRLEDGAMNRLALYLSSVCKTFSTTFLAVHPLTVKCPNLR